MNHLPVDLLQIVYDFIPRTTDNDIILERLHSVLCFDTTEWLCGYNFDVCRIRTTTDVHLVFIDFSSTFDCVRLCVTDVAYIRIPGKLLQHPDKMITARFLLSLLFNVVNERLPNPQHGCNPRAHGGWLLLRVTIVTPPIRPDVVAEGGQAVQRVGS